MDEIEVAAVVDALQYRCRDDLRDRAPAHIGHRQAFRGVQTSGDPRNDAETVHVLFLGGVREQLHAEANAKNRLSQAANHVDQAMVFQSCHGIRGGADEFFADRGMARADHDLPIWSIDRPGRRIALVAHAGTNSVSIAHLLGLEPTPWEWERFVIGHTSVSRLEALELHDGFTFSLTKLSDLEHLGVEQRTR